jgi:GTP cyclohydrolase I
MLARARVISHSAVESPRSARQAVTASLAIQTGISVEEHYKAIIEAVGEDPNREGLLRTPQRAAKAMEFLTQGYKQDLKELVNDAVFTTSNNEMVIVRDIELYSMCEHHLLPFLGRAHIAYLPNGKVIGLSKIPRIVDMFARRLQIQEKLTQQIGNCVQEVTDAKGVAVVVEAKHLCAMMRGVEKQNSSMTTSMMLGRFRDDPRTRQEFLTLIRG